MARITFVGAGPGDPDLITIKGKKALEEADIVVYAGSLVPTAVLSWVRPEAELIDSAPLTLPQIKEIFARAAERDLRLVRLHSGDPCIFGAVQEQIDWLVEQGLSFEIVPGVTSAFAAAAALGRELTVPEVSQAVLIGRLAGRTPVPPGQELDNLARPGATLCLYLSVHKLAEAVSELRRHYDQDTPAAVVYHASRPDQQIIRAKLANLASAVSESGITKTAVVIIGPALASTSKRSRLYDPEFKHEQRP